MRFPRLPVKDANGPCWECQEDDVEDCADPCGHGHCEHKAHCDVCGTGLDYRPASGTCFVCDAQHLASHQLIDSAGLSNNLSGGVESRHATRTIAFQGGKPNADGLASESSASPAQNLPEPIGIVAILADLTRRFSK